VLALCASNAMILPAMVKPDRKGKTHSAFNGRISAMESWMKIEYAWQCETECFSWIRAAGSSYASHYASMI
jgi:hypothetical protein